MTSKSTLILLFNLLILNQSYAKDSLLESCESAVDRRQYTKAITIAASHTTQPPFLLCKGRAQAGLSQYEQAQESFRQAIALNPQGLDRVSAYMLLGNVQQANKQTAQAIESYREALKLSEQQNMRRYVRVAHNLIGEALFEKGQYAESLQAFESGEKLALNDDERADSYLHVAVTYLQLQQIDRAIEYQLKAVMMLHKSGTPGQYAEASLALGKLFTVKKDYVGAEKTFKRLIDYARENGGQFYEAKTMIHLAEVKKLHGDQAAADQLISQATTLAAQIKDAELDALLAEVNK